MEDILFEGVLKTLRTRCEGDTYGTRTLRRYANDTIDSDTWDVPGWMRRAVTKAVRVRFDEVWQAFGRARRGAPEYEAAQRDLLHVRDALDSISSRKSG